MQMVLDVVQFGWQTKTELIRLSVEHMALSFFAIVFGVLVAVPLGIWSARHRRAGQFIIELCSMLYTIPSLALLGFLIPFFGIGQITAIVALFIYSLLPLLRNTCVGILEVDDFVKEAALGMGATRNQLLLFVELPLALPFVMAGLRTVTVLTVGITTMGALVGAGGLGVLIFRGMHMMDQKLLLLGTIPVAIIAIGMDNLLGILEQRIRLVMGITNHFE